MRWIVVLYFLLGAVVTARADERPEKVVALAFIQPCPSYVSFVAPLLKEHGFGATFYIDDVTKPPPGTKLDESRWLPWEGVRKLSELGFELGNATTDRQPVLWLQNTAKMQERVEKLERLFSENGLPKPTTFCFPGGWSCGPTLQMLADHGYSFAVEYHQDQRYEPALDHPLLVPGFWFCGSGYEPRKFREILEKRTAGQIPVLVIDGVQTTPTGVSREQFKEYVKYLADNKYTVVAIRDLARYVNAGEAMRATRLWRRDGHENAAMRPVAKSPAVAATRLQNQLEALTLPALNWQAASLDAALNSWRQQVAAASGGKTTAGLVLDPTLDVTAPVTLRLTNTPAMEVLRYLGDLTGADFTVGEYAIAAKPRPNDAARVTAKIAAPAEQKQQLEMLMIPEIAFDKAPLQEALDALGRKAEAASRGQVAPRFVLLPGADAATPVSLRLANVPLAEALRYLGDLTRTDFVTDRYAVSARPRAATQARFTPKTPADRRQIEMLQSLMILSVEFKDASLGSAVEYLRRKAVVASGDKIQPYFVVQPGIDVSVPVTLNLTNIPFTEALRYCGDLVGGEFVVERYAISLKRKEARGQPNAPVPFALVK